MPLMEARDESRRKINKEAGEEGGFCIGKVRIVGREELNEADDRRGRKWKARDSGQCSEGSKGENEILRENLEHAVWHPGNARKTMQSTLSPIE